MTDSKGRSDFKGGRPTKEVEDPDWRARFCEVLLATKSRLTAAEATPYNYDTIYKMLNENYSEYDKHFAEMVHLTEMRFVARAEQVFWEALEQEPSPRNRGWLAKEALKVLDRKRWSDKLDVSIEHKGVIKFEANRQRMLAELAEEQMVALEPARKALSDGKSDYIEVTDVEEVKELTHE